ncbi:MAG TPA: site-specific integrase, partial [Ktedonobacteraceae bacterium]|nr:site-specific integrase [Ktedonobacteraceae bacterium]
DTGKLVTSPTTTVAAYLQHWIADVRGPQVRPKTRTWYEQAIRCHIVPQIGSQRLDKLTPEHVRQMVTAIQTSASTASAQQAHRTLATALKDAVDEGIVERNVAAIVRRPKHSGVIRREFTFEESREIIRVAAQLDDQVWGARVVLAFMTGARPGELLGLRWQYVDLDAGNIEIAWHLQEMKMKHGCAETYQSDTKEHIPSCVRTRPGFCPQAKYDVAPGLTYEPCYRSLAFTPVKTRAGNRVVPMLPIVVALLRQMYDTDQPSQNDLVFHHPDGRPYAPHDDTEMWKALLKQAGLPPDAVGYQSRHTAATLMRRAGADEALRMSIMGHSSAIAHRGYAHVDQSEKLAALNPLASLADPSSTPPS